jgi:hypothetical protein
MVLFCWSVFRSGEHERGQACNNVDARSAIGTKSTLLAARSNGQSDWQTPLLNQHCYWTAFNLLKHSICTG